MPYDSNYLQYAADSPSDPTLSFGLPGDSSISLTPASRRAPSDRPGKVVQPQLLKHPSLFDNIRKTLASAGQSNSAERQAGPFETRERDEGTRANGKFVSPEGVAGDDSGIEEHRRRTDLRIESQIQPEAGGLDLGSHVLCAKWDSLPARRGGAAKRVLLLAYKSGAFAIWDCSNLDSWRELVSLRSLETALSNDLRERYSGKIGPIVDFTIISSTTLALVTRRARSSSSHVLLYAFDSHRIATAFAIPGTAHKAAVNRRYLVVSTSAPLALHFYSASNLQPTPFSPITDLVPSPYDGAPVFSLGAGGRLLAYATSRSIPSSHLDRSPARPGAGLLAHSGFFNTEPPASSQSPLEFFARSQGGGGALLKEAGQAGEQVARKVSEGVLSGVKAIGEVGMNYWMTKSTSGRYEVQDSAVPYATLSRSAPANTGAGIARRPSITSPLSRPLSSSQSPATGPATSPVAGTILVVDLASSGAAERGSSAVRRPPNSPPTSSLRVVSHFRPYHLAIALLSFSPSSTSICASSTLGLSFDVFELHPVTPIGVSALRSVPASSDANSGKVWHRYRLNRGYTSARATSATWSDDGRLVAIGTGKGTVHVYAIQPTGGQPNLEHHFEVKVKNLNDLPPLSMNLSTIARIRPSTTAFNESFQMSQVLPVLVFVPKAQSFTSSFRPNSLSPPDAIDSLPQSPVRTAALQDLLVFEGSSATAQLHRLSSAALPLSQPSSTLTSASRGEIGKLATTAMSGLTQLMKSRGNSTGINPGPGGSAAESDASTRRREYTASCGVQAAWRLERDDAEEDIMEDIELSFDADTVTRSVRGRWSAFAEIETFSRSPRVLPRSIYESQQCNFYTLPSNYTESIAQGIYHTSQARKLEMRSQVVIRSASPSGPSSANSTEVAFEPASFDQPIRSAMQTVLDQEAMLAPGSPKLPAPSFPVGIAAKQGNWRSSIPIRSVGPAAYESFDRVRQGLGKVRLPKAAGELVGAARRRSLMGSTGQVAYSSSISFDDEEAVFTDRLSIEDMGSTSTACTSEGEEGALAKEVGEDEWTWNETNDEAWCDPALKPEDSSGMDDISSQPLFDDADFDNFELELSTPPPTATAKPASPRHSIAVGLSASSLSQPTNSLAPSLSLPVPVPVSSDNLESEESSLPLPDTAQIGNPLLEIPKPKIPIAMSSSPSSASSLASSPGGSGAGGGSKKKKRK